MTVRHAHLRIARATNDIDALLGFYRDGLGFDVIGGFDDHDGFDGVMLGHQDAPYHLEIVRQRGHDAGRAPSAENQLVFYLPERAAWQAAVNRMEAAGHEPVPAANPYWDRRGLTFEDADGYRIVLQHATWPPCT